MSEKFFEDDDGVPFSYDPDQKKLFRMSGDKRTDVTDSEDVAEIIARKEIPKERAIELAFLWSD